MTSPIDKLRELSENMREGFVDGDFIDIDHVCNTIDDAVSELTANEQKEAGGQDANPANLATPAFKGLDADAERCSPNLTAESLQRDIDWIIRLLDTPEKAARSHHRGIDAIKYVARNIKRNIEELQQPARGGEVVDFRVKQLRSAIEDEPEHCFGVSTCEEYRAYSVRDNLLCILDKLEEALAQPPHGAGCRRGAGDVVAYMVTCDKLANFVTIYRGEAQTMARGRDGGRVVPLYAGTPPRADVVVFSRIREARALIDHFIHGEVEAEGLHQAHTALTAALNPQEKES